MPVDDNDKPRKWRKSKFQNLSAKVEKITGRHPLFYWLTYVATPSHSTFHCEYCLTTKNTPQHLAKPEADTFARQHQYCGAYPHAN